MLKRFLPFLFLTLAYFLFLWMFWSTESFKHNVEQAFHLGLLSTELSTQAKTYAVDWRHGMEDFWPCYMPGFFALGFAILFWSSSLRFKEMIHQGLLALGIAASLAFLFYPAGEAYLHSTFFSGLDFPALPQNPLSLLTFFKALITVKTWSVFLICWFRDLKQKKLRSLYVSIPLFFTLYLFRQKEAGSLVSEWLERIHSGDFIAYSSLLFLCLSLVLTSLFNTSFRRSL